MGDGPAAGDELGVGEPEVPDPPAVIQIGHLLKDLLGGPIPDTLPFDVGIKAEGAEVGASSFGLNPHRPSFIGVDLGEDRLEIGEVYPHLFNGGCYGLGTPDNFFPFSMDCPVAEGTFSPEKGQEGRFPFPDHPDHPLGKAADHLLGEDAERPSPHRHPDVRERFDGVPDQGKFLPDLVLVAPDHPESREGRRQAIQGIFSIIESKGRFQGSVPFMGGVDLDVPPGKGDHPGTEGLDRLPDGPVPLPRGDQGKVQDPLARIRNLMVNGIGKIGHPQRVDLLAGEPDIKDGRCHPAFPTGGGGII